MSFLFPLYLAGAAAVALPIYLHLRRRPPKDAVEFSSLMFLEPTRHQPLKRRSQLEHLALLALRCLALLLLAAMFSRPFLAGGETGAGSGAKRSVIVLDTSASMRRGDLWEKATAIARDAIGKVRPEGALAILTIGQTPRTLIGFNDWRNTDPARRAEFARRAVDAVSPGWDSSDLGSGLIAAAELVADASGDEDSIFPAEVVLVSDLQSGAQFDAVTEAAWPDELSVVLAPVGIEVESGNASLSVAASADPKRPSVRVRNDPDSASAEFEIRAGDQRIRAVVPAGESRTFELENPESLVVLSGDGAGKDFDNRVFLAPHEPAVVDLQFIGAGKPDDSDLPEYYFRRAFGMSDVMRPRFVEDLSGNPQILAIARAISGEEAAQVRARLEAGGSGLVVVTATGMAGTLGTLAGIETPELSEHVGRDYALLEKIDFDHPALGEFSDPRWRDFTGVHFWRHREIDPAALPAEARVIASFDTGSPAWIEIPVGRGKLLVMMSGWHPRDSQLSLSSKFLPLLFSMFSGAGPGVGGVRQFFVGDPLPLGDVAGSIQLPDGKDQLLVAGEAFRPSVPGVYRVAGGASFAVNLRPSESELAPLGKDPLVALGVPVGRPVETNSSAANRELRKQESEAAQNLWRWAVIVLLAMLVAESWLGSRTTSPNLQSASAP